ncbi:MAG TPA: hypothetical protein VMY42_23775 [Thermoguttaceae bacterium]|nr:hypothetical protein [Thermoguttaceae bacterium]
MVRSRATSEWNKATARYVERLQGVLEDLEGYWPLTLRQVYYQLVAAGAIANTKLEYAKLSRVLTKARLDGVVSWGAIEDRTRSSLNSGGWANQKAFVATETERFLEGYRRDLLQSQDCALELWVEKDALSRLCHDAALPFCVSVIVARGYSSVSYVHEARQRIERNVRRGFDETKILYFGDLDPSGWNMLPAMMETLQEEMGLGEHVVPVRCALTPEQVEEFDLPHNPDALKPTDTRARAYVEQFGELAVELDALPPATLQALVKSSIEAELDMIRFQKEQARETTEIGDLEEMKVRIMDLME